MARKLNLDNHAITCKLDQEIFSLRYVAVDDALSVPVEIVAEFSSDIYIEPENVLGKITTITINNADKENDSIIFSGVLHKITNSINKTNNPSDSFSYLINLMGPLHKLSFHTASGVYQKKTTIDILKSMLDDAGLKGMYKFESGMIGRRWETCVKYNETDYDFLHRMLAGEGWFYYHKFLNDGVQVCFAQNNNQMPKAETKAIWSRKDAESGDYISDFISWTVEQSMGVEAVQLSNYSDQKEELVRVVSDCATQIEKGKIKYSYYGGDETDRKKLEEKAKSLAHYFEKEKYIATVSSMVRGLNAGTRFEMSDHQIKDYNQEYLVTKIRHVISATGHFSSMLNYKNDFLAIPASIQYKPEPVLKNTASSTHRAIIAGEKNTQPEHDEQGQVSIVFPWDENKVQVPARTLSEMAGAFYGSKFISRAGDHVIVDLNDNHSIPSLLGSYLSGNNKLPIEKNTQSGIVTREIGGGMDTGNKLIFEDAKDKQELILDAQRDLMFSCNNDSQYAVGGIASMVVEKTLTKYSKEDFTSKTDANLISNAGQDTIQESTDNHSVSAGKDITVEAVGNVMVNGETITLNAKSEIILQVAGTKITLSASGVVEEMESFQADYAGSYQVNTGKLTINIGGAGMMKSDGTMIMEGQTLTTLKSGALVQLKASQCVIL